MVRRLALLLVTALVGIACDVQADDESTSEAPETTITTSTVATPSTATESGSVTSGKTAMIDFDGNVVVLDPDGSGYVEITTDAGEAAYTQPVWAPDSDRIAFGQITESGFSVRVDDVEDGTVAEVPVSNQPFYMYWSPDGASIGVLHNGSNGLDFELVNVAEGTASIVDQGSPFYFSWSPDGQGLAIHEGADRFETLDLSGGRLDLGETSPDYLAPHWTPQGILHVSGGSLLLEDGSGEPTALADVQSQTMFVANDQGTRVAVQSVGEGSGLSVALGDLEAVTPNVVSVLDTETGEIQIVDRRPSVGFWWSPDGEALLILSPTSDRERLTAKVWESSGTLTEYATHRPSPILVRELFPFFPQYAQSMTFWAPDSSGFAVAGEIDERIGIWVQDLEAEQPYFLAEGVWVSWSNR